MRRLIVALSIIVVIGQIAGPAAAEADVWADGGRNGAVNKTADILASDQDRVPGYGGTTGVTSRQTKPACTTPGHCEVPIQYSECLAQANDMGITPTTAPAAPSTNTYTYQTVCGYALPETRTRQVDPRDEQDVVAWVKNYFSQTALPVPAPEISAKNGGICGVIHTLDLHMSVELQHREQITPFGALDLHIYGRVEVDWGDGTKNTYTTGGGPYPSSIEHSWTTRGSYRIATRANWVANYRLGPYNGYTYTGTLSGLATEGSIDNFQVWEAQAMLVG